MSAVEVRVPDLGEVKGVTVLDVLVKKGDKVAVEDPLISLESDKAAMDVPSPVSGVINSIEIKKGDAVSSGTLIAIVEADAAAPAKAAGAAAPSAASAPRRRAGRGRIRVDFRGERRPETRVQTGGAAPPALSTWWCSVPVSADTPPHFARQTWG